MQKKLLLLNLFLISLFIINGFSQGQGPYLSHLNATKDSPVYTTYAAAMERSEFTLDEGYHFLFYDTTRGADFITDTGGDLCLAFKRGADYVYPLGSLSSEPVITASYPDMVKYFYFPFADLRVDATFCVYSSHLAVWDLQLQNTGIQAIEFQLIPFIRNDYRVFNSVEFSKDKNAIAFNHEELPDGWVMDHDVPYVTPVGDVFLLSTKPDRQTSYRSYKWGMIPIPQEFDLNRQPKYVVWGKLAHADGERCRHRQTAPQLEVTLDRFPNLILTETAPRWGRTDSNISPYGFYSIELGNFGDIQNGNVYRIRYFCPETGESGIVQDTIRNLAGENSVRKDMELSKQSLVAAPVGLNRDIWGSGTEMRLYWKDPDKDFRFNVYRRDYRKDGAYQLMEENSSRDFFTDKNIEGDQIYGYIIEAVNQAGERSMPTPEINNISGSDFLTDIRYPNQLVNDIKDMSRVVAMPVKIELAPGKTESIRIVRAADRMNVPVSDLIQKAGAGLNIDLDENLLQNEKLFQKIPNIYFGDKELQDLYWSNFSLMRQVMLPPEGKSSYNYYVFSREPTWGWGHGGQVFHESLTMLAYAFMDPLSAMDSQRVYRERQHQDGYINYRTGSYLDETIPENDQLTTSAPWYAWQNLEVFRITRDKNFLKEMYDSSKKFYLYYTGNRDSDGDGLCEWGAHAVLESVRDARVAVWDEVGWPSNFEALDLNCMLVKEAKSLAEMARQLNLNTEVEKWEKDAAARTALINQYMWDPETGFYYHVDKKDHDFSFKETNDLKREEIIGFLPLWAGVTDKEQAKRLIEKLTDPEKFWRQYGVPSLSADDSYYNPKGYWNGPVWVEWDMLIVHGLKQYGYDELAKELTMRVARNMIEQLKKDHQLWEFYSPDDQWAGYHRQYIWAGTINRMLIDVMDIDH